MKQVVEEIYQSLSVYSESVHFNFIPEKIDNSLLHIVYEVNITGSDSSLDKKNYSNTARLQVKILHESPAELLDKGREIMNTLLGSSYTNFKELEFNNDVPIFYDRDLKLSQYTLLFSLHTNLDSNTPVILKPLDKYSDSELVEGLTQVKINHLASEATWRNSNGSMEVELDPGEEYTAPDVTHTDSDETPVLLPMGIPFVAKPISAYTLQEIEQSVDPVILEQIRESDNRSLDSYTYDELEVGVQPSIWQQIQESDGSGSGGGFSDEAINIFNRYEYYGDTTLSINQLTALNTLINTLKENNQLSKIKEFMPFYGLGSAANATVGWFNSVATNYGATYAFNKGFIFDGSSTYLDSNYNASNLTAINDFTVGLGIGENRTEITDDAMLFGVEDGSNYLFLWDRNNEFIRAQVGGSIFNEGYNLISNVNYFVQGIPHESLTNFDTLKVIENDRIVDLSIFSGGFSGVLPNDNIHIARRSDGFGYADIDAEFFLIADGDFDYTLFNQAWTTYKNTVSPYSEDATNAITRIETNGDTLLTTTQKDAIAVAVDDLVATGQYPHFEEIFIRAGLGSASNSLVGLKEYISTNYGASWTNEGGFVGDGTTAYLDTGINLVTAGLTAQNVTAGVKTGSYANSGGAFGAVDAEGDNARVYDLSGSNIRAAVAGDFAGSSASFAPYAYFWFKHSATALQLFSGSTVVASDTLYTSGTLPDANMYELAINGSTQKLDGAIQLSFYGNSQIDYSIVQPIFDTLLTALGVTMS